MMNLWDYAFDAQDQYPAEWPALYDGAVPAEASARALSVVGVEGGGLHAIPESTEVGDMQPMFSGDFYNRIHVYPSSIDMGNVVGLQQRELTVWNAYYFDRELQDINLIDAEGISIDGPSAPLFFSAFEELSWEVTVGTNGPPVIDATVQFDFDLGEEIIVPVTGNRVIAWAWVPNWESGIIERLEWLTDVIPSYDGSEQRRKLRLNPRRSLEFRFLASESDRRILESIAWGWGARVFAVPLWQDGQDLQADLPAGSTSIALETETRDYQEDGLVILMGETCRDWEVCEISSVGPALVSLTRETINDWPAGTRAYPAHTARLNTKLALSHFTSQHSEGRVLFDFVEPHVWEADGGDTTYRGHPVLTTLPNWASDPGWELERQLARYDNETGVQYFDDESERPATLQTLNFTFATREETDAWRKLLHALAGRHKAVWVRPSTIDIILAAPILSAAVALDFEWIGYNRFVGVTPGKKDIRIALEDGTVLYRRITSSSELDSNTERFILDSAPGVNIDPADVVSISFIALCRLDSDAVELAHWTGDVCESSAAFKGFRTDA